MDQYIRDFEVNTIETYTLANGLECKAIYDINKLSCNFKIIHNNIRSINKNLDLFKILLEELQTDFDCIVLTETWNIQDPTLYNITGYDMIYNNSKLNQNDGVVVYIKSEVNYNYNIIPINNINSIKINIKLSNQCDINITAMYRPPSTDLTDYLVHLQNYLQAHHNEIGDYHIFIGDINIDILQNSDCSIEYMNILNEFGYISCINNYTRVQENQKSCLDHIFIRSRHNVNEKILPIILQTDITDHFTTMLQIVLHCNKEKDTNDREGFIRNIDYGKFQKILSSESWESVYVEHDVDTATKNFVSIVTKALNDSTNLKKIKRKNTKLTPWVTSGLVKSIHKKNEMYRTVQKNPNNDYLKSEYRTYKNRLTNLINKTKYEYYKNEINKNKTSSKSLWKTVREISKTNSKSNTFSSIKNENGELITNSKEMANEFNKTFTKMGENLANKINKDPNFKITKNSVQNSMVLLPTDTFELKQLLNELKNKKSPGLDNIKAEVLKSVSEYILKPLEYIFNTCMTLGIWPSIFKESVIIPVYKKGNKEILSNYRPISLITHLSKLFEKVIKKRLTAYINKYKPLSDNQFGFKKNVSTQDALLALTSKIYSALDESKPCLCVFLDLSKAFDTVSHELLLQTLEDIGLREVTLKLFKSYISNRPQRVRINNELSESMIIKYGVPQGTVLGPILFSIYIDGLFSLRSRGEIVGFADDTAIFYKADSWTDLRILAEDDLSLIKNWFDNRLLTINFNKTHYLPLSCNKSSQPTFESLEINIRGALCTVLPEKNIKYLGVFIDSHLRWDVHINYIIKKLQTIIYKFKYLKNILDFDQLKMLYHSLVESHLRYCILGWGGVAKTHLTPLETLQKRFLKIMLGRSSIYPSDLLYTEAKLFDIRQLYYYNISVKYQLTQNIETLPSHVYNTRQKNKHIVPFMMKTVGQRSYAFLAPTVYNTLPNELQNITKINSFKKLLKKHIIENPRKLINDIIDIKNIY